ncbi:uncharacterized protein LOC62_07G009322 [Vanrija pseudolonga]|uniref:Mediator of RNA polymerase II transcription subunit 11 n=1 Tax=Vanrija pseudolonga TaxID=143232 RepID=A0AAF0YFE0_9TREE|nr:hypothetical protein LOC62_07G009322 [Vanrija pseudolonga]
MAEEEWADPLIIDQELDTDVLLKALGNVDKEIPNLLLDVKPVIAHLVSLDSSTAEEEAAGMAARDAVERYMRNLDNIQVILRQAVYFLRETRAAPSVLRPPAIDGIPRPLAATLAQPATSTSVSSGGGETALGLYAARTEVAALREMLAAAKALRAEEAGKAQGEGDGDGLEVDAEP